jgi:hypothetical protein
MTLPKRFALRSLDDLDSRTNAAKNARRLVAALEDGLGGHDALSAGQRELATRTALTGAMCQDFEVQWLEGQSINIAQYATLINAQRRLLLTLGLRRQPLDITPDDDDGLDAEWDAAVERQAREVVP